MKVDNITMYILYLYLSTFLYLDLPFNCFLFIIDSSNICVVFTLSLTFIYRWASPWLAGGLAGWLADWLPGGLLQTTAGIERNHLFRMSWWSGASRYRAARRGISVPSAKEGKSAK